jgi:hypothetical protein
MKRYFKLFTMVLSLNQSKLLKWKEHIKAMLAALLGKANFNLIYGTMSQISAGMIGKQ